MKRWFGILGMIGVCAAAAHPADTGDLAAALAEKLPEDRVGALVRALERTKTASPTLVRCLEAELASGGHRTVTERLLKVWRNRPADLRCADLALRQALRGQVPVAEVQDLCRATLKAADLPRLGPEERGIFFRQLHFYLAALLESREVPAAADFCDLLIGKFPRDPVLAHSAARLYVHECFLDTDTAPGMRNWTELSADNRWKARLLRLRRNADAMCVADPVGAEAFCLLAVELHDAALLARALAVRADVPVVKGSGGAELPEIGIRMRMPELCRDASSEVLPLALAAAGDIPGAEKALADVAAETIRDDLRLLVLGFKRDDAEIRRLVREENIRPRSPQAVAAVCGAAMRLRDTGLLEILLAEIDPDKPDALPPEIANALGFTCAELNYRLALAERLIGMALRSDPKNFGYLDSRAWLLFRQGKAAEARQVIGEAIRCRRPTDAVAVILLHAADIELAASGDRNTARQYLNRAENMVGECQDDYDYARAKQLRELLK
ncbi:MAG: hypothetical protein MR051_08205 [Lentisphaeria bacterium]|nr:hypothetical protein [Lentisphaeria bacterium]